MATGLEVAGLILATFPLIISALESYENGFRTIKEWSRFRNEFMIFMKSVGKQKLFFRQNIEELLAPIIKSEDHMLWLLNNPGGEGWRDKELNEKLRKRLTGKYEYECYMSTVGSILALLEKLKGKLKLFRRLSYTLGRRKREGILANIEKHNNEIQTILSNSERLTPMRMKRKSPITKHFQRVRSQASSLHAALTRAWKCDCTLTHATKLLLERRAKEPDDMDGYGDSTQDDSAVKFQVYFYVESLLASNPTAHLQTMTEWCATEIMMDLGLDSGKVYSQLLQGRDGPTGMRYPEATSFLHRSSLTKSTRPLLDNYRRVSFADTSVSSKSITSLGDMSEIIDLCSALNQRLLLQQNFGYLRNGCSDRFHTVTLGTNSPLPSGSYKIISLESLLDRNTRDKMGLLPVLRNRRTRLAIAVTLASSLLQLHPGPWLRERWGKQDIYFFQSGDGTIHTQLPFLLYNFKSSNQSQGTPHHYTAKDATTGTAPSSRCGYNPPLLSLGIVILELWFNQTIESLPFRKDFLGVGGKETEYTDYNTAQKWQEQTMDEAGLDLHNPTRRCIYCAFGAASQNLEDDELRKAVYEEVVQPLERLLQRFEEI
ncbi:hypothetical protein BDZ91DRAFT_809507 [Kalaharituber pfeilii]|nr:hypothetical protein BDZ91DRAFT_809507 [Kalaharituber pfeilii]